MKVWYFPIGALILGIFVGCEQSASSEPSYSSSTSFSSSQSASIRKRAGALTDISDIDDGEFDCTVSNATTGNGPYSLLCEKDGDEITIHFPNGGFLVVDEDGYHARTGTYWEVEVN